jgi:hypothetical protein
MPQVGDIVMLEKDGQSRKKWPLGKITRLLSDSNGFARAAEILCQGKLFVRSTRHLYPLEGATSVEEVPDEPEDERAQEAQPKEAQRKVTVTRYGRTVRPIVH